MPDSHGHNGGARTKLFVTIVLYCSYTSAVQETFPSLVPRLPPAQPGNEAKPLYKSTMVLLSGTAPSDLCAQSPVCAGS